ncbi:MAG: beta-propeller domain-containing protein [Desulfurococcaceae archaeon]
MNGFSKIFGILLVLSLVLGVFIILTPFMTRTPIQVKKTSTQVTIELEESPGEEPVGNSIIYNELVSQIARYAKLLAKIHGAFSRVLPPNTAMPVEVMQPVQQYSKTNVQVYGIDEQDVVKTDGRAIYLCKGPEIIVVDVYNSTIASRIRIPMSFTCNGLYVDSHLLITLLSEQYFTDIPRTLIYVFNVENIYNPVVLANFSIDGILRGSRLKWPYLYVVTQQQAYNTMYTENNEVYVKVYIPRINGVLVKPEYIEESEYPPKNYIVVFSLDLKELSWNSITVLMNNVERIYMSHNRLYIVGSIEPMYMALRKIIDQVSSTDILPHGVLERINNYVSKGDYTSAYEALHEYLESLSNEELTHIIEKINNLVVRINDKTIIAVLEINGLHLELKGSIEIRGLILDQFAIEEFKINGVDYLVAATTTNEYRIQLVYYRTRTMIQEPFSINIDHCYTIDSQYRCINLLVNASSTSLKIERAPLFIYPSLIPESLKNTVYVVKPDPLEVVGILEDLAPGERTYSARLINNVFYLVTFRIVDPLYAIDLNNPERPVILGYLKIPGFSEYLHPISHRLLLGVGREDTYLKISLFDISDPRNIVERTFIKLPGRSIIVDNDDYHAFLFDERYNACYIPVALSLKGSSGILVVFIDKDNFTIKQDIRFLDHSGGIRTLYVENKVFTISYDLIRIWSLPGFDFVDEIPLN